MTVEAAVPARHEPGSADAERGGGPRIERLVASSYTVPTDRPESDGTLAWTSTSIVVVEAEAAGTTSLGYGYADPVAARLIAEQLAPIVIGADAWDVPQTWRSMVAAVRNLGRPGVAATAISAVDVALWDLKARLLGLPLADLLGRATVRVPVYGSGGFTSYSHRELADQLGGWAAEGFRMVKMKVGRDPDRDPGRVAVASDAIGPDVALFVDANGAYDRRTAVSQAEAFGRWNVRWFEEPVSSDDLDGLRFVRDHVPPGMAVAAGEYAWGPDAVRTLVSSGGLDVLQVDATRCLGATGFALAADVAEAWHVPLSAHCAPALHTHLMAAARPGVHLEWYHDHVRIERLLFDGAPRPVNGSVAPDRASPGLGLTLRRADADGYRTWSSA